MPKAIKNESFRDFSVKDWRSRPRMDARGVRSCKIDLRVTPAEQAAIKEQAAFCNLNLSDYIVCRALRISQRVSTENDLTFTTMTKKRQKKVAQRKEDSNGA